ncbi:MAG: peptide-methionine (S)-S-oxide reductase MsrA [candidate division Zixibacteria bacterium]
MEKAVFAVGCFWGVETVFSKFDGVVSTTVGYTGGNTPNPTYREVCSGQTGHAEAVEIKFNPEVITYRDLLDIFWINHDPTMMNYLDYDLYSQYRSAIFYNNLEQRNQALESAQEISDMKIYKYPIATEILPTEKFYPAEEQHQRYFEKKDLVSCEFTSKKAG